LLPFWKARLTAAVLIKPMWFFNEKTLHLIWLGGGLSSLMASWFGLKSTRGNLKVSNKTHQSKTQSKTRGSELAREDATTFNT
jgi:hypothetical protein